MGVRIAVNFEVPRRWPTPLGRAKARTLIRRAIRATLREEGIRAGLFEVTLLGDEAIADLNHRFLGHDGPTDIITFALYSDGEEPVGDIYIGWDQALRQASALAESPARELVRLAIHGTLHLLGYDHPEGTDREMSEMWQYQEDIFQKVVGI